MTALQPINSMHETERQIILACQSRLSPGCQGYAKQFGVCPHQDRTPRLALPHLASELKQVSKVVHCTHWDFRETYFQDCLHQIQSRQEIMVLGILTAIAACPAIIGTTEAVRQGQRQNAREKHRGLKTNLVVVCSRATANGREIDGCEIILAENKVRTRHDYFPACTLHLRAY
jgi:hypothetical protein